MTERHLAIRFQVALLGIVLSGLALGQAPKQLILNGEIECDLQGSVVINADGDILAEVDESSDCLNQEPPQPPEPPQLSRTVIEVVAPGEIRLDWSSSPTATDCVASSSPTVGGWNGSVGTGENQQTLLSDLSASSYNFSLVCSNSAGDSLPEAVSATISTSSQCADRQPPAGWARMGDSGTAACYFQSGQGYLSNDCTVWNGGIGDGPFYEETGNTRRMAAAGRPDAEQYLAIQLNTTGMSPTDKGRLTTVYDPFADSPGFIWSISSCPGDIHQQAVEQDTGCYGALAGFSTEFRWGGTSGGEDCQLETNQIYYLNLIPTSSPAGTHPDQIQTHPNCEDGACGRAFQWQ